MRCAQLLTFSILFLGMLLTSCGTFSEEVWINADGSGRYVMDYDAAESLAMLEMMGQMGGDEETSDSDNPEDVMKEALAQEKFDTSFNLMSAMPDSIKQIIGSKRAIRKSFEDRGMPVTDGKIDTVQKATQMLEKLDFSMRMDKEAGIFGFGMTIDFDDPKEVSETFGSVATLQAMGDGAAQTNGMADKMGNRSTFEMVGKNKVIVRQAPATNMDELLGAAGDSAEGMDAEQMEGMLEMMGLSSYTIKVHVPGIVKSVEGGSYVKENDNTVVFTVDYLKAMKGGELMEAEITFKPKKNMKMVVPN